MKYCITCLQPNTRPGGLKFKNGEKCAACNYFEDSKNSDWDNRFYELEKILSKNKKKSYFDCIIGVSGGKDSTRQALWIRDKLGLKPLLVCLSYPPEQVTKVGASNISNLINLGFDLEILSLSPETWKEIMKYSFLRHCNWARGTEQALISAVPNIALKYDIKLIFWGENPGFQLGDMKSVGKTGFDGQNINKLNTTAGGKINWLKSAGFSEKKIFNYEFPNKKKFNNNGLKIIYLGWFWKDWSLKENGYISYLHGLNLRKEKFNLTQDLYGVTSLDEDWVVLNQMIKFYKYGFGRVTDYMNEEIRRGLISREDAIKIVNKYDGNCHKKYINSFCKYLGISQKDFWKVVKKFTNKKLFTIKNNKIIKKFKVGYGI
tara:strand:- start:24272 stop:25396 length:1125 start_codon:yes stop_codon:yes gene_type:complete